MFRYYIQYPYVLFYTPYIIVIRGRSAKKRRVVSSSVLFLSGTNLYLVFRTLEINDCKCDHRKDCGALNWTLGCNNLFVIIRFDDEISLQQRIVVKLIYFTYVQTPPSPFTFGNFHVGFLSTVQCTRLPIFTEKCIPEVLLLTEETVI